MNDFPFHLLVTSFIALFVVVDPVGTSAMFVALTNRMERAAQRRVAVKAAVTAALVLIAFCLLGHVVLNYINISLSAFRIAAALLLLLAAARIVMGFGSPDKAGFGVNPGHLSIFPLTMPLLAGPCCITAALMFASEAHSYTDYATLFGVIVLVEAIALACMLGAAGLARIFGGDGTGIVARILGILLAAIAVQFLTEGIDDLFGRDEPPGIIPDMMG
jgi:multiple antibiotic resistance protein